MNTSIIRISLILSMVAACGDPCLPTINADTLVEPAEEACLMSTGAGSTSGTSAADSTATGAVECPGFGSVACGTVPSNGDAWGPCLEGACAPGQGECLATGLGDICVPACGDCGCPDFEATCDNGTCTVDAAPVCVPGCVAVGDPCPLPGMTCDPSVKACVYVQQAPACPGAGEQWGPCAPGGACVDGLTCINSGSAWTCAPACNGMACDEPSACASPAANLTCNANGPTMACGYECIDASACAPGQVCDPAFSLCMWPQ